jgi:hypothetical protein
MSERWESGSPKDGKIKYGSTFRAFGLTDFRTRLRVHQRDICIKPDTKASIYT